MSDSNMDCERSGSFCTAHKGKWPQGAKMCKKADRFPVDLLTGERMAPGAAYTIHPLIALAMQAEKKPKVKKYSSSVLPQVLKIIAAAAGGETIMLSVATAEKLSKGINPGSKLQGTANMDGTNIKVFIPGTMAADLERKRENLIRKLAEDIDQTDVFVEFAGRKMMETGQLTRCIVAQNLPDGTCQCGEWHDWDTMPAISRGGTQHFGFGPGCAMVAGKSVRLGRMLSELITGKSLQEMRENQPRSNSPQVIEQHTRRKPHWVEDMEFVNPGTTRKKRPGKRRMTKLEFAEREAKKEAAPKKPQKGKRSKKDRKAMSDSAMAAK